MNQFSFIYLTEKFEKLNALNQNIFCLFFNQSVDFAQIKKYIAETIFEDEISSTFLHNNIQKNSELKTFSDFISQKINFELINDELSKTSPVVPELQSSLNDSEIFKKITKMIKSENEYLSIQESLIKYQKSLSKFLKSFLKLSELENEIQDHH